MKKTILFVDDEPRVLQAIRHLMADLADEWQADYAESAAQAHKLMSQRSFNALVADLVMPGTSGAQLLNEVMHSHPQTTRVVMCWQAERAALTQLFGIAHQYLYKPCDPKALRETLGNIFKRGELMSDDKLKRLVSQLRCVPSLPTLYAELMREMRSEDASLEKAGEIITRDPGMTAKIMQLVNSAFFGLRHRVTTPQEATIYLGIETVKALVLSLQVFSQFDRARIQACHLEGLWDHSWTTGVLARQNCMAEARDSKFPHHAFIGGQIHDIGKLVLATNLPDLYRAAVLMAKHKGLALSEAERETFGATHAEVGGFLLGLWGLPDPIVEAVAVHHGPSWSTTTGFSAVTAVHVANALDHENATAEPPCPPSQVDLDYLASRGLMDRYACWQALCWDALAKQGQPLEETEVC